MVTRVASKHKHVKFVKIPAPECIENYPERYGRTARRRRCGGPALTARRRQQRAHAAAVQGWRVQVPDCDAVRAGGKARQCRWCVPPACSQLQPPRRRAAQRAHLLARAVLEWVLAQRGVLETEQESDPRETLRMRIRGGEGDGYSRRVGELVRGARGSDDDSDE